MIVVGAQGESPNSDKYLRKNENQRHFLEKALKDANFDEKEIIQKTKKRQHCLFMLAAIQKKNWLIMKNRQRKTVSILKWQKILMIL